MKTADEKAKELQDEIRKKTEKLIQVEVLLSGTSQYLCFRVRKGVVVVGGGGGRWLIWGVGQREEERGDQIRLIVI